MDQKSFPKLLLRPAEAAEALGLGRSKTYELIAAGTIPFIRIGKSVRVPADALRAWVLQQVAAQEALKDGQ